MSATITKYWRTITFDFSSKGGNTTGVFDIEVDNTGVPINYGGKCVWENVSGDSVTDCMFEGTYISFTTDAATVGILSNFVSATENTTYTESDGDLSGTWSYVASTTTVTVYTITSSASAGGTISPTGKVNIEEGDDQTFSFVSSTGYTISSVLVDGVSAGTVSYYTFTNVQADHTISVAFEAIPTYTITATAGAGGTISPSGETTVNEGDYKGFEITPSTGCATSSVLVDGVEAISQLVGNEYTFQIMNAIDNQWRSFFVDKIRLKYL